MYSWTIIFELTELKTIRHCMSVKSCNKLGTSVNFYTSFIHVTCSDGFRSDTAKWHTDRGVNHNNKIGFVQKVLFPFVSVPFLILRIQTLSTSHNNVNHDKKCSHDSGFVLWLCLSLLFIKMCVFAGKVLF